MILTILFAVFISYSDAGSVGNCRTECIEKNVAKIVRVHLKDALVMIGLCSNNTDPLSNELSIVTPFVCHRNIGLWTFDELDKEGIVKFPTICPAPEQYPLDLQLTCPRINENRDGTPIMIDEGSGDISIDI